MHYLTGPETIVRPASRHPSGFVWGRTTPGWASPLSIVVTFHWLLVKIPVVQEGSGEGGGEGGGSAVQKASINNINEEMLLGRS